MHLCDRSVHLFMQLAPDGGILVDEKMRSSCEGVYAAGDACTIVPSGSGWDSDSMQDDGAGRKWFQMRLWTQVCDCELVE